MLLLKFAEVCTKQVNLKPNGKRSEFYFKAALPVIDKNFYARAHSIKKLQQFTT